MARVTIMIQGEATVLDPADPSPFIAAAREWFVGTDGDMILVRGGDGSVQAARAGWYAVVPDGGGRTVFVTPGLPGMSVC